MKDSSFADKKCWLAIAALLGCSCAAALSPDLTIKGAASHGLGPEPRRASGRRRRPRARTTAICGSRARTGCFDSTELAFERVELPHDPKLSSWRLYSLFAPRGGGLWVGFTFGGVALLKEGSGRYSAALMGFRRDHRGSLPRRRRARYGSRPNNGLARFDGARWKGVGSQTGFFRRATTPCCSSIVKARSGPAAARTHCCSSCVRASTSFAINRSPRQRRGRQAPWRNPAPGPSGWTRAPHWCPVRPEPPGRKPGRSSVGPVFDHDGTLWDSLDGVRRIAHPERTAMGAALHLKDIGMPTLTRTD